LLVYPVFGEVSDAVEPARRRIGPDPADRFAERRQVLSAPEVADPARGPGEKLSEGPGADPLHRSNPLRIVAVEKLRERFSVGRLSGRMNIA
jgi:hypothetical protein